MQSGRPIGATRETPQAQTHVSRRRFLMGAGGALVGGGIGGAFVSRGTPARGAAIRGTKDDLEVLGGQIVSIDSASMLRVRGRDAPIAITLAPNAYIWRDKRTTLGSFKVGEEVVGEGHWRGAVFAAGVLTSMYFPVEGRVLAAGADNLLTTGGMLLFVSGTRLQRGTLLTDVSARDFSVGDPIKVLARHDPQPGTFIALRVYAEDK